MISPKYTHDCEDCQFIGHYADHDLYICPQVNLPTFVARRSSEPSDYQSGGRVMIGEMTFGITERMQR